MRVSQAVESWVLFESGIGRLKRIGPVGYRSPGSQTTQYNNDDWLMRGWSAVHRALQTMPKSERPQLRDAMKRAVMDGKVMELRTLAAWPTFRAAIKQYCRRGY